MNIRNRWTTRAAACLRRRLSQVRNEDGFTIVEVVVTAAMVAMIAGGAFAGLEATGQASSDLRHRSTANELAQQDQERMRGMSIQQLSGLSEPNRKVVIDGTNYWVSSKGTFLGGSGGSSCSDQAADYVQISSTVVWGPNPGDKDARTQVTPSAEVQLHSIVSPPAGGTILVHVHDDLNVGQPGVTATVAGGSDRFDAATDSQGCAYFSGLALGGYYVLAAKPAAGGNAAWVTPDGTSTAVTGVGTTAAGTKTAELELAQAGGVTASFSAKLGTGNVPGEAAGLSWSAPRMTAAGHTPVTGTSSSPTPLPSSTVPTAQVVTPLALYPFHNSGVTTNNYEVWAGRCTGDQVLPATSTNKTKASVAPNNGGSPTSPTVVKVPAMAVHVYWKPTATSPGTYVKPSHIQLTDSCSDNWQASINPIATYNSGVNAFAAPGQAYGIYPRVCVDYDPPGSTPVYRAAITNFANTNFTGTGNTIFNSTVGGVQTLTITGGVSANQKLCSSP
jgi:type II secretory pathway pseudopilin PulG